VEEKRGRDAGAGGGANWAAAFYARWAEKKKEGGSSGPSGRFPGRGRRRKINLSFFYLFKTSFKFNLKSV